jgi:hypothetical protein
MIKLNKMIISVTNILRTQVIVGKTIIEKTKSNANMKMLDKCTIETQSSSGHQVNARIPIAKRPLGDQRTKNHLVVAKRSKDRQSHGGH